MCGKLLGRLQDEKKRQRAYNDKKENPMNKIKQLLIVLTICIILAGSAVFLCLLDPNFTPDAYRVASMVLVVSWAFFIVPSMLFGVQLATKYFEGKSPEHAFRDGVRIGVILGFGGILVLSLLVSPITGILWYIHTVKIIVLSKKNKNQSSDDPNENDFFNP